MLFECLDARISFAGSVCDVDLLEAAHASQDPAIGDLPGVFEVGAQVFTFSHRAHRVGTAAWLAASEWWTRPHLMWIVFITSLLVQPEDASILRNTRRNDRRRLDRPAASGQSGCA